VTFAQRQPSGQVVVDNPGLAGAPDVLTCSTTSPVSGQAFTFRGFLTPRG
jgi:16S rRNA C1402 (ribose-2'-O) methylase RsmI